VSTSEGRFEAVRAGRITDLLGREHELGLLIERWNLAQNGDGHVVLLSGEPGGPRVLPGCDTMAKNFRDRH
jgi:hypothetical protein